MLPLQDTKKCYWNPQEKFKIDMTILPYPNLQSVQDKRRHFKRRNALTFLKSHKTLKKSNVYFLVIFEPLKQLLSHNA